MDNSPLLGYTSFMFKTFWASLAASAFLLGCSSAPKNIELRTEPGGGVIVVLDDPGAEVFLMARDFDKLTKKILKIIAPHLDPKLYDGLASKELAEIVCQVITWLHIDQIPPEFVGELREQLSKIPSSVRSELFETVGLKEFGVAPLRLKARAAKTYAVIAWRPGHKPEVTSINPFKAKHDQLTLTLKPR